MNFDNPSNRALLATVVGAALAAGLGFFLHAFSVGHALVNHSYDLLLVARGEIPAREAAVVNLDEISHDVLKQPLNAPWDRRLHARLIERLTAAGAKAIVFDVVFNEPNPAADEILARAMKAHGRVILAADNVRVGPKENKILRPADLLLDNVAGMGSTEVTPGRDLIVREHTPEDQLPSLSWAAAEALEAASTRNEAARAARRWVNYYGPPDFLPWRSYHEALDPARVGDEFFRGKVVVVGARILTKFAGDRKDEFRNPFTFWRTEAMSASAGGGMFISGVEIQATMLLNLLRGDWLTRLPLTSERLVVLCLGAFLGAGLMRFRPVPATGLALAALVLAALGSHWLLGARLVWFPWLIVVAQILLALFCSVLFNSVQLYVQKRMYEQSLSLYLPPKLVQKFSSNRELLKPGAEEQTISILFTDIADFTALSQALTSEELAKLMNQYFHIAVSECIHKTDGTVVKYIGDAIFAFWNEPEPQPDHALRACQAALHFRDQGAREINGRHLRTRLGIHTGKAHVGNFGSTERVDYTALGESVNLASRLEGLNKYLGTDCVMSGETKAGIGDQLLTRPLGQFQLKGFEKPLEVHELVGWPAETEATRPWREAFAEALGNYQQRNPEFAEMGFRRVLELRPDDGPAKFYIERIAEVAAQALPGEWATHTVLREK